MVAAGFKKNFAMKVANIIERSIAVPIEGIRAEIERMDKSLRWILGSVAIPTLILMIGGGGYMAKQTYDINADVAEIKGSVAQLEKRMDDQFEDVDGKFEDVDGKFESVNARIDRFEERVDAQFKEVKAQFKEVDVRFKEVDKQLTDLKIRSVRMEEQGVQRDKVLNSILVLLKEKAGISSSVPEAVPGETDISFDPDQDQPTLKPKEDQIDQIDQIRSRLDPHSNQPRATPLTKQADVSPDVQPMQAGQPKPPHNNKGGGIGGPEGYPSE